MQFEKLFYMKHAAAEFPAGVDILEKISTQGDSYVRALDYQHLMSRTLAELVTIINALAPSLSHLSGNQWRRWSKVRNDAGSELARRMLIQDREIQTTVNVLDGHVWDLLRGQPPTNPSTKTYAPGGPQSPLLSVPPTADATCQDDG